MFLIYAVVYIVLATAMSRADRKRLFDQWAENYDTTITSAGAGFPFDGYEQVLDEVVRWADVKPGMRILDLGIGTGNLAARFLHHECSVWGIDFSAEMLAQTRAKLPQINLVQADLLGEWPPELQPPFDRVVSAYVLHEFKLAAKVKLLQRAALNYLSPSGRILVADIAFLTSAARQEASQRWAEVWDEDEDYWAADEAIMACERAGLQADYRQVSCCGGIFTFRVRGAG